MLDFNFNNMSVHIFIPKYPNLSILIEEDLINIAFKFVLVDLSKMYQELQL